MTSIGITDNYNVNTLVLFFILLFYKPCHISVYFAYRSHMKIQFDSLTHMSLKYYRFRWSGRVKADTKRLNNGLKTKKSHSF